MSFFFKLNFLKLSFYVRKHWRRKKKTLISFENKSSIIIHRIIIYIYQCQLITPFPPKKKNYRSGIPDLFSIQNGQPMYTLLWLFLLDLDNLTKVCAQTSTNTADIFILSRSKAAILTLIGENSNSSWFWFCSWFTSITVDHGSIKGSNDDN